MKIIVIFVILSVINVVFSVVRELLTVNGSKSVAAIINAAYFSFYNVMIIYTVANFPLWIKCIITFFSNLIGVYVVKYFEEKNKPTKLWKIELALPIERTAQDDIKESLIAQGIENNYVEVGKWTMFNCYCETKEQTSYLNAFAKENNGRISAYESVL